MFQTSRRASRQSENVSVGPVLLEGHSYNFGVLMTVRSLAISNIASGHTRFDKDARWVIVALGLLLFLETINFLGNKYGHPPDRGTYQYSGVLVTKIYRWVCPLLVIYGIVKMS